MPCRQVALRVYSAWTSSHAQGHFSDYSKTPQL